MQGKKRWIAAGLLLAGTAQADWREQCAQLGEFAEMVMQHRQNGATMAQQMQALHNAGGSQLGENLVIQAYRQPRQPTARSRTEAVEEFASAAYLECVQRLRADR